MPLQNQECMPVIPHMGTGDGSRTQSYYNYRLQGPYKPTAYKDAGLGAAALALKDIALMVFFSPAVSWVENRQGLLYYLMQRKHTTHG
jgi:hypothetical protein